MTRFLRTGLLAMAAAGFTLVPSLFGTGQASAAPCPDVEVTFARATTEPPGIGGVGQAFVDSLRSQVPGKSVAVYAVNYPATEDFTSSASAGATDANNHAREIAANCPTTRIVLGGYSQGALVVSVTPEFMGVVHILSSLTLVGLVHRRISRHRSIFADGFLLREHTDKHCCRVDFSDKGDVRACIERTPIDEVFGGVFRRRLGHEKR